MGPPDLCGSPTSWAGNGRHDGVDPAAQWPILRLAQVLVFQQPGGRTDDLPGTLFNLWNAERELGAGILRHLDVDAEGRPLCVGFMAWARISLDKLPRIARENVRVVPQEWYTAAGAVAFCTEALAYQPRIMVQSVRHVSELPGVQIVCGWRNGRFRIQKRRR